MPPIPVHIDDPISPAKATDQPTSTSQASYPAAQPGAAAVAPAATPYIPKPHPAPAPTKTTPSSLQYAPPAPQPGAVPLPHNDQAPAATATSASLPPPPKAGEAAARAQQQQLQARPVTTMPPQMGISPPAQNYAPSGTRADSASTTYNLGAAPSPFQTGDGIQPPPSGYVQNVYAQELSSAQRASLDVATGHENSGLLLGGSGGGSGGGGGGGGGDSFGGGAGLGGLAGDSANETAANVWKAVKGWANAAGEKLAETEEEVWKRINGGK